MAQIALSLTLLFSAGLFFRGALKAGALNPGFDRQGAISAEMDFTLGRDDEEGGAADDVCGSSSGARPCPEYGPLL